MQNVIYAVIGVVLTVAAMYMVSPSISKSSEAIQAGILSADAGSIKTAAKTWLANSSVDGTYKDFTVADLVKVLPDFKVDGDYIYNQSTFNKHKIQVSTTSSLNDSFTLTTECESEDFANLVRKNYKKLGDVSTPGTGSIAIVKIRG